MLIGKITHYDPTERIAAAAPASLRVKLELYAEMHERLHGQKPNQSDLVLSMLGYVLENDAAFKKDLSARKSEFDKRFAAMCKKEQRDGGAPPAQ